VFSTIRKLISAYFLMAGLVAHVAAVGAAWWALGHYDLTPRMLIVKAMDKSGVELAWLRKLVTPAPMYGGHALDGRIRAQHPRILLPRLAGWKGPGVSPYMRNRLALYRAVGISEPKAQAHCGASDALVLATCWIMTGNDGAARRAITLMRGARATMGTVSNPVQVYGIGAPWRLALAYDLLANHPAMTDGKRVWIEDTLRRALVILLEALDAGHLSQWHSRASISAEAWMVAVALGSKKSPDRSLISRAQAHFLATMGGLRLTEAWPEGYNYWINSRAMMLALGASAYVNGLDGARHATEVTEAVRRSAYWPIHAVRPDHRIAALGVSDLQRPQRDAGGGSRPRRPAGDGAPPATRGGIRPGRHGPGLHPVWLGQGRDLHQLPRGRDIHPSRPLRRRPFHPVQGRAAGRHLGHLRRLLRREPAQLFDPHGGEKFAVDSSPRRTGPPQPFLRRQCGGRRPANRAADRQRDRERRRLAR